jgi:hypothetical protein
MALTAIKKADMNARRIKLASLAAISTSVLLVSAAAQQPSQDTMRKTFAEADDNKDGFLNVDEYIGHVIYVFRQVDRNRDGFLTEQEVMAVTTAYRPQLFKAADRNGDGKLSVGEACAAKIIDFFEMDTNRDGVLSIEEVLAYERSLPVAPAKK